MNRAAPVAAGAPRAAFARLKARAVADRRRPEPLWAQVRDVLAEAIRDGSFAPDDRMPSEHALGALFGVSRPVIREALAALAREGAIVTVPRRGAFVAPDRDELDFAGSNIGLFGEMTAKGREVATRIVGLARVAAPPRPRRFLGLPLGADIVQLRRVYAIDGRPLAVGTVSVPAARAPGLERIDFENRSLYATLRERYGLAVARAERWLEAVPAAGEEAALLELVPGDPVVRIESVAWAADGAPVEYYDALYNTRLSRVHLRTVSAPAWTGAGGDA